ncbi:MAG: hypothetical protein B7Z78_06005 [Rhodospirillales bacterium 20-60-12]|nr:MAG: hypothetical protein B7Z78_06005 [Rhodospirillales bacterium 20-60-12]HQT66218.1 FUSC family protein [Acetobacteraceae bacterium]
MSVSLPTPAPKFTPRGFSLGGLAPPSLLISPVSLYVARTVLAMLLALYAAFLLQLPSPSSAAITVMIVANPARGAIISKAVWRIFGTVVGAVVSVILIGCFPQSSMLFLAFYALWLGFCVFLSNMFRHFRGYAAVLAGYTVAIIAFGTLDNPTNVIILALSRVAVVVLGVIVSAVVTMVFQPGLTSEAVLVRGMAAVRGVAHLISEHAIGMDETDFQSQRSALAASIEQLDETVEFAGAESFDVSVHAPSLRRGFAALYAALVTIAPTGVSLSRLDTESGPASPVTALAERAHGLLRRIADTQATDPQTLADLQTDMRALLIEIARLVEQQTDATRVARLARLEQGVKNLLDCVGVLASWRAGEPPLLSQRQPPSFRDYAVAWRNALRAMIACMLAGIFWYVTAWSVGAFLPLFVGVIAALLSGAPSAAAASVQFAKGVIISVFVAFIVGYLILPHVTAFVLLALIIAPILAAGVYASTKPAYALVAFGFVVFFITQINLTNQMTYNIAAFLNTAAVVVFASGIGALCFRVLLPPDPARDARGLIRDIRRAVQGLARGAHPEYAADLLGWQVRVNQRIQRLFLRLQYNPAIRARAIGDCGALLIIAQEILHIRQAIAMLHLTADEAAQSHELLTRLTRLDHASLVEESALQACAALSAAGEPSPAHLRLAARFRTIAALMPQAQNLFALETRAGVTV